VRALSEAWALDSLWKALGVLALFAGPTVTWLIARASRQSSIDEARNVANREAFEIGAKMRDELRVELIRLSAEVQRQEKEIEGLQQQLGEAKETLARETGHWEAFKSMWCPKTDCPVLLRRQPIWDGVERREPGQRKG
jgi:flagellar motility protein MotE (MotC chaperone)